MSLIKIIGVGDELVFDLKDAVKDAKQISVYLCEKAGRKAVLKIDADRSIPIRHFRQQSIGQ
jgi:hypothetical protein